MFAHAVQAMSLRIWVLGSRILVCLCRMVLLPAQILASCLEQYALSGRADRLRLARTESSRSYRIVKLVRALRKGWIQRDKPAVDEEPKPYLLWADDGQATGKTATGLAYVPAPKPKLPGHEESYNPPKEYLPTEVSSVNQSAATIVSPDMLLCPTAAVQSCGSTCMRQRQTGKYLPQKRGELSGVQQACSTCPDCLCI